MKNYFLIGAKILGLYLAFRSLLTFFQAIAALIVFSSSSSEPFAVLSLVSSGGALIILLFLSFILLFKTEKIASILKIEDSLSDTGNKLSIQTGIILIGLYIFSTNIGGFFASIYFQFQEANAGRDPIGTSPKGLTISEDLVSVGVTIIFSVFLIFGSKVIDNFVCRPNKNEYNL
jgi:hypothetical protein